MLFKVKASEPIDDSTADEPKRMRIRGIGCAANSTKFLIVLLVIRECSNIFYLSKISNVKLNLELESKENGA